MNDDFYYYFIDETTRILIQLYTGDFQIIFREKSFEKWRVDHIRGTCRKYGLKKFQITYPWHFQGYPTTDVESTITGSDIVFVMGYSTTGWEALAKRKKFLIVNQEWNHHPFETYLPEIVAKTTDQIESSFSWLIKLSQEQYNELIEPLMENCSKLSNGNMVREFIEFIENMKVSKVT